MKPDALVVSNCRAYLTQLLHRESVRRNEAVALEFVKTHGRGNFTLDDWFDAVREGDVDLSAGEACLDLAYWFMRLDDDDPDLLTLAVVFPLSGEREFPSPDSRRLLETWGTEAADCFSPEDLLAQIVTVETSAALDGEMGIVRHLLDVGGGVHH